MLGAKPPGYQNKDKEPEFVLRGRKIAIRHAGALIVNLVKARDLGQPVIFQDSKEALNKVETPPEEVQIILEEAMDLLKAWMDQVRRPHTGQ